MSDSKLTVYKCGNCGKQLDAGDICCSQCGREETRVIDSIAMDRATVARATGAR